MVRKDVSPSENLIYLNIYMCVWTGTTCALDHTYAENNDVGGMDGRLGGGGGGRVQRRARRRRGRGAERDGPQSPLGGRQEARSERFDANRSRICHRQDQ